MADEIKKIEGVITNISEKSGEKNGKSWTRWGFTIVNKEGVKYDCSTFDKMISENAHKDEYVVFNVSVQGKYNNISELVSVKVDEEAAKLVSTLPTSTPTTSTETLSPQDYLAKQKYWEDKENRQAERDGKRQSLIVRQSCLSQANKLIENMGALGFSEEDRKKLLLVGDPVLVLTGFADKLAKWCLKE